ncbi:MAG: acyl-CoA dehydrogenase family protein [Gaiellales bacterium]
MDFSLTPEQQDLRDRARRFADALLPHEVAAEEAGGRVPDDVKAEIRVLARELRLVGGNHAPEHGGQGWSMLEHVLVHEQLGRVTNGLWWLMGGAYNVLALGTPEQIETHLRPTLAGERADAYAVTERDAGSDATGIKAIAERVDGGFRIRGEKWFVTSGDHADYLIVMANVLEGGAFLPTLFLVDLPRDGVEIVDDPGFTHVFPDGHPTYRLDCVVPESAVLGGPDQVGQGAAGQHAWFVEERIHIAARCVGAMQRLLDEAVGWATERRQFGQPIMDFQGVSFPLADSAADCVAARLLTYQCAQMADDGAPPKLVHARAAMAKLFASERAWVCADRAVQTWGGRGYMRRNAAERLLRELRVDRIWEGTSEIQRLIVANALVKRGVPATLAVDAEAWT